MNTTTKVVGLLLLLAIPFAVIWDWAYSDKEEGIEMTRERRASLIRLEREQNYQLYGTEAKPYEELQRADP
jgi:hypothetical protein